MKQFIKDNRPYTISDREDLTDYYLSVGCEICPVLYDGTFKDPIWNGSEWIEGLSVEQVAELNKPIVPAYISRMNLKIVLLLRGIEMQEIIDTINSIPESMFSLIDKQIAIIKFNEAVSFDRYNADLNLVGVLMDLSQTDLDEIFLAGNNL